MHSFSVDIASNTVTNGIYSDEGKTLTFGTDYTAEAVLKGNQVESGQLVYPVRYYRNRYWQLYRSTDLQ